MSESRRRGDGVELTALTDADYGADKDSRKAISGATTHMNGMLVSWHCKQQGAVALSTAEAEFVAGAIGTKELLGLRELVIEFGTNVKEPMAVKIDNQAAIKQITNEATNSASKHVDIKIKFVRDVAKRGLIKPEYVNTKDNIADLMTKALPAPRMQELCAAIGLH